MYMAGGHHKLLEAQSGFSSQLFVGVRGKYF